MNTINKLRRKVSDLIGEDYQQTPRTKAVDKVIKAMLKQIVKGGVVSWGYECLTDECQEFLESEAV